MQKETDTPQRPQNAILQNCRVLTLTGVIEVMSFDEQAISLDTDLGRLEIRGKGMHIETFDTKSGDMSVNGYIYAVVYTQKDDRRGFFKRVFS